MTTRNSKTHLQPQELDPQELDGNTMSWKQDYKAWLNELKKLRTKKVSVSKAPVSKVSVSKAPVSKVSVSKAPVSKARNNFNNFYDDGMTANRNYLSEEELKWII